MGRGARAVEAHPLYIHTYYTSHIQIKILTTLTEQTWVTETKDRLLVRDLVYNFMFMQCTNARHYVAIV
jgi:hypothetical protein